MESAMVKKLRIVNKKFFINLRMREIMTNFYLKLLTMGIGKNYKVIEKLKILPERKNEGKINRANVFERNIINFYKKYILISQNLFRTYLSKGTNAKFLIIKDLVSRTMSKDKKYLLIWKNRCKLLN